MAFGFISRSLGYVTVNSEVNIGSTFNLFLLNSKQVFIKSFSSINETTFYEVKRTNTKNDFDKNDNCFYHLFLFYFTDKCV